MTAGELDELGVCDSSASHGRRIARRLKLALALRSKNSDSRLQATLSVGSDAPSAQSRSVGSSDPSLHLPRYRYVGLRWESAPSRLGRPYSEPSQTILRQALQNTRATSWSGAVLRISPRSLPRLTTRLDMITQLAPARTSSVDGSRHCDRCCANGRSVVPVAARNVVGPSTLIDHGPLGFERNTDHA